MIDKILSIVFFKKTKQELKDKTVELNKYRLILDQSPAAVYIINKNMHFEYMNPSFTKQSGYTKEDLINKHVYNTIYKGEIPESRKMIVEALLKGETWQGELLSNHKSGSTYWASTTASPYKNELGEVEGFVIIQQDITENKKMEISLQESENLYRTLIENSLDAVVLTQDFKFLYFNKVFLKLLGYTNEEMQQVEPLSILAPEDRDRIINYHILRMKGEMFEQDYIAYFVRKDGSKFLAEMKATSVTYNGKLASFITMRDVTAREALHNALIESEEKYRQLVETTNSIILKWDKDFKITFLNEYGLKFFGFTKDEIFSNPMVGTIIPHSEEYSGRNLALLMEQIFTNPEYYANNTNENIRKNGERVWIQWNNTAIKNEKGETISMFSIGTDVTQNKRMQMELKESEEKYRQLFAAESDAIFMINADTGQIIDANPAATNIYGYSHTEMLAMKNTDISAEPDKTTEATKKNQTLVPLRMHKKKDGTIFPVELSAGFTSINNTRIQIVTSRDITERINTEKALTESENKYRTLIDKATDGILIAQDGVFKFVNQAFCEMMEYTEAELLNKSFIEVVDKRHHTEMIENHKKRMSGDSFPAIYRARLYRKGGSTIMVELNSRTTDFEGKPASFVITRDITERLKIEEELQIAKNNLELLNLDLEKRVKESSESLTEARTQLINAQKENIQSQFDVLRQQVNPHFLFNSLNVLTSLIKLEPDLAEKFSEHLSKVYRYVLENKDNELVDLKTELNFLDAYIFLLNIRFVGKLKVNIDIPQSRYSEQIIPLAMQLLIENAIKHNIMSKAMPLTIDIFIDTENYLNIVNNLNERPSQLVSTGVGLKNIQNRYLLLNNTEPIFEKTGTHFIAKVPLIK